MNFNDNLKNLRIREGLSQEQLADEMGVSRQSISKWEKSTLPDTEGLIKLSNYFDISIDDLLKKEIKFNTPDVDAEFKRHALYISLGVLLILLGGMGLIIYDSINDYSSSLGFITFLALTFIAVIIFVITGINHKNFMKDKNFTTGDNTPSRLVTTVLALSSIFTGVLIFFINSEFELINKYVALGIGYLLITIGIIIFTYTKVRDSIYEINETEKNDELVDKISGVIMLFAVIVFLTIGFIFNAWHPAWIVFPIGGLLCGIAEIIINGD